MSIINYHIQSIQNCDALQSGVKRCILIRPGVMGMIFLLISTMMTSIAIVREKELGTMEILLVSPMKPFCSYK